MYQAFSLQIQLQFAKNGVERISRVQPKLFGTTSGGTPLLAPCMIGTLGSPYLITDVIVLDKPVMSEGTTIT